MGGEGPANYDYFDLNRENLTKMVKIAETLDLRKFGLITLITKYSQLS